MAPPLHAICLLKCRRGSPSPRRWVSLLQGDVSSFVRMCRCDRSFIRDEVVSQESGSLNPVVPLHPKNVETNTRTRKTAPCFSHSLSYE
ncbi:Os12g0230266 [Oryza sativa Japonica Group]|uniref:Os12g0230266 protein n=1 Tax=Oryza sativa subsp. japonica TaxID=39947 RepID=A0A0P0Y8E0_ORYSJ|nr:Os12g0230266 [Oryza sativa Japonica Group]